MTRQKRLKLAVYQNCIFSKILLNTNLKATTDSCCFQHTATVANFFDPKQEKALLVIRVLGRNGNFHCPDAQRGLGFQPVNTGRDIR